MMKLLAAILLSVFTAFSVGNVKKTADNTYTVDKDVVAKGETDPVLHYSTSGLPKHLVIATTDCQHVPPANERAIILVGPQGTTILFSQGGTCRVAAITDVHYECKPGLVCGSL